MTSSFQRIASILARDYMIAPDLLRQDAVLAGLGIDSLHAVELLWTLEEAFGITLPAKPVMLNTVADLVWFIDEVVAAQHTTSAGADTAWRSSGQLDGADAAGGITIAAAP